MLLNDIRRDLEWFEPLDVEAAEEEGAPLATAAAAEEVGAPFVTAAAAVFEMVGPPVVFEMLSPPLANAAPVTASDYIKKTAEDLPKANPASAPPYRHDVPVQDFLEPIQSIH